MKPAAIVLRDAMQAFVSGYTDNATAVDIDKLRATVAHVFPAAAPIDGEMLRRMLRAVGFVGSLLPGDAPGIWRRAVRPEEVMF
ncbi:MULTISPECIES: hypothetical protein [unclassified Sphingomonas]|uniref:hypothetical protein n=1 Tax=unclassified Sphingomonas TaxID=196159 RepID=UPI0006FA5608|nr:MULTISPECIES: hypothetical protein [unclassified Sphingomonas]KQM60085.1 hypothetical protein ASE65_10285 [Sphingomonas sp. Leaf16]KQN11483.1 hypothetical protein ASE81_11270 [Sphingomonas sp. Leaf29]KQN18805.1 hypothetical protein ASE83_11210 [Sphingomonas sp. Leaf32]